MATRLDEVENNMAKGGNGEIPDESVQSMSLNENTEKIGINNDGNDVSGSEDYVDVDDKDNVFLLVEGRRLSASRVVLCLASPVFKTMFGGSGSDKREIELQGKKYSDVKMFYDCIDPRKLEQITTVETVYTILPLAVEYRVESLMARFRVILPNLVNKSMNAEGLCWHLHLAVNHNLSDLEAKCVALCSELKTNDMTRWMDHFNIPASVQLKVRDLALRRHELKEEATTSASGFGFGGFKLGTKASTTSSSGFSFGGTASTTPCPGFNFGATASTSGFGSAGTFGTPASRTSGSMFGGPASATPCAAFNFGATASTPGFGSGGTFGTPASRTSGSMFGGQTSATPCPPFNPFPNKTRFLRP